MWPLVSSSVEFSPCSSVLTGASSIRVLMTRCVCPLKTYPTKMWRRCWVSYSGAKKECQYSWEFFGSSTVGIDQQSQGCWLVSFPRLSKIRRWSRVKLKMRLPLLQLRDAE
uniref:Uncharacterized protein n=1 Tax=Setaria viridis TaxID=4556 RepID=A0A4U6T0Z9_SETVI|nr:hypothetical protein SEVIR_9G277533v2 [Setaria viridis]